MPEEPAGPVDESAAYWSNTYDREPRMRDRDPGRPLAKAQRADPAPPRPADRPDRSSPPRVRSGAEALGEARRYIDAVLMLGFGVLLIVASSTTTRSAFLPVVAGIAAIGYAGHIALFARSYTMPYFVYGIALFFGLFFLFG